jgi:hypothetical protein
LICAFHQLRKFAIFSPESFTDEKWCKKWWIGTLLKQAIYLPQGTIEILNIYSMPHGLVHGFQREFQRHSICRQSVIQ